MKWNRAALILLVLAGLGLTRQTSHAFALLGPVAPWMQASNGVVWPGDIGGPMELGSEYRWNVPVVTYGFDQSFLDFFGTNGVKSVQEAIQIFNSLPPASELNPADYPIVARGFNSTANQRGLIDLKSATMSVVLEQMGLGEPTRSTYLIKVPSTWQTSLWQLLGYYETPNNGEFRLFWHSYLNDTNNILTYILPDVILQRNFDPQSLNPSNVVNGVPYWAELRVTTNQASVIPYSVNPLADVYNAVADQSWWSGGVYFAGLTRDDVGGLKYLWSATNINFESRWRMGSVGAIIRKKTGAWRPGVEKVSFVPHPINPVTKRFKRGRFIYTDSFYDKNSLNPTSATGAPREIAGAVLLGF